MQGRANKDPQFLPGGDCNAIMLQGRDHAVDNSLAGIGQGSV